MNHWILRKAIFRRKWRQYLEKKLKKQRNKYYQTSEKKSQQIGKEMNSMEFTYFHGNLSHVSIIAWLLKNSQQNKPYNLSDPLKTSAKMITNLSQTNWINCEKNLTKM